MFQRALLLPEHPKQSFFLWGPRQAGKSTLLLDLYPNAYYIDLLRADTSIRFLEQPWMLRETIAALPTPPSLIIIDEVQKVPALLDEVHYMIERMGLTFGLCGSSARKVRRGQANLLGGRAVRYELHGLTRREIADRWNLPHALNTGSLPRMYLADDPQPLLEAYVNEYLKEEILAEGLVRRLPPFADALRAIALSDGQRLSFTTIARECGVSHQTVREYVQILEDTMIGSLLPAYTRRPKRRVIHGPKFYFFDVGIVNVLAKRGRVQEGSAACGSALENWIHHELQAHSAYSALRYDVRYWQTSGGTEVDFILGDMACAVEVKATKRVSDHHLKSLRTLREDYTVKKRICVSLDPLVRRTSDDIDFLPVHDFCERLWDGALIR